MADVVFQVQVGVIDPDRAALPEGHETKLLAEAGHEVEPGCDVVANLLVVGGRSLEEGRRGNVHVGRTVLEMEERAIEAAEPIAVRHGSIFSKKPQPSRWGL